MTAIPTLSDILTASGTLLDAASRLLRPGTAPDRSTRRLFRRGRGAEAETIPRAVADAARAALAPVLSRLRDALRAASGKGTETLPQDTLDALNGQYRRLSSLAESALPRRRFRRGADPTPVPSDAQQSALRDVTEAADTLLRLIDDCPTLTDWSVNDVLVGSQRSEEQYRVNLEHRFYYAPVGVLPEGVKNVRTIALWRSASTDEPGIRLIGDVTSVRRVRRRRIPVPMSTGNGDEPYYLFTVREWVPLARPVGIRDEGVYAPRLTNRFLLLHAEVSYDLFHVRTEGQYRLLCALRQAVEDARGGAVTEMLLPSGHRLTVGGGRIDLTAPDGHRAASFADSELSAHPRALFASLKAAVSASAAPDDPTI